uniref:Uncharacterized protein n=1 Tax=Dunaliella tertiolecta TaxID=3047 RepID=A0A7S3VQK5_DUNTE
MQIGSSNNMALEHPYNYTIVLQPHPALVPCIHNKATLRSLMLFVPTLCTPWISTSLSKWEKSVFKKAMTCTGSTSLDMDVKPQISMNIKVALLWARASCPTCSGTASELSKARNWMTVWNKDIEQE